MMSCRTGQKIYWSPLLEMHPNLTSIMISSILLQFKGFSIFTQLFFCNQLTHTSFGDPQPYLSSVQTQSAPAMRQACVRETQSQSRTKINKNSCKFSVSIEEPFASHAQMQEMPPIGRKSERDACWVSCGFLLLQYSMRGKVNVKLVSEQCERRHKRGLMRHQSEGELFIDMSNLWKSNSREEERLFAAIKQSDLFSEERLDTFVKFNYRTMENKNMNYHTVFQKTLAQRNKLRRDRTSLRGSMNVSQLWSERNLQDVLGSLPYPKDRLKVLHSYEKSKALRIRALRNRQIQAEAYLL